MQGRSAEQKKTFINNKDLFYRIYRDRLKWPKVIIPDVYLAGDQQPRPSHDNAWNLKWMYIPGTRSGLLNFFNKYPTNYQFLCLTNLFFDKLPNVWRYTNSCPSRTLVRATTLSRTQTLKWDGVHLLSSLCKDRSLDCHRCTHSFDLHQTIVFQSSDCCCLHYEQSEHNHFDWQTSAWRDESQVQFDCKHHEPVTRTA